MPSVHVRSLAALLAAWAVAACGGEEEPAPLTHLVIPPEARALAVIRPAAGGAPDLFSVDAGGAVSRVARVGEALRLAVPLRDDEDTITSAKNPRFGAIGPISREAFVVVVMGADDDRYGDVMAYVRAAAAVARDGAIVTLPLFLEGDDPGAIQADAAGHLYCRPSLQAVYPLRVEGGVAAYEWRISAATDAVTAFALDDAGNLAYRAARDEGTASAPVAVLRPAVGPIVTWPDDGRLGSFWRGADGRLYVTRAAEGEPGTTELLRIDFGLDTVATPVLAWAGAPGLLEGEPVPLGGALAFVRAGEVVLLPAGGAPPEVHALGFAHRAVRASAGALWLVTEPSDGAASRLVRWEPGLPRPRVQLLLDDAHDLEEVVPLGDDAALAGVVRRADGARLLLRVTGEGATDPVDPGVAGPVLADGLLLP